MNISLQGSSTYSILSAASELNSIQGQQERKKKRQVLPENIIQKIVYHAWIYGNPEATSWASKKYP